jgi:hypothetical protein
LELHSGYLVQYIIHDPWFPFPESFSQAMAIL